MPLSGLKMLVVEDESLIAMMVEMMLLDLGAASIVCARNVETALTELDGGLIDCALLDVNLGSEKSFAVAYALEGKGIPFAFASGLGRSDLDGLFPHAPLINKPFLMDDLSEGISTALTNAPSTI